MGGVGSGRKIELTDDERRERSILKQKQWKANNYKHVRQQQKQWRAINREYKLSLDKKWQADNKEYFAYIQKRWRDAHKEEIHLTFKEWYQKKKVRVLTKYLNKLKYERKNPGRNVKYYYANKERILARRKELRIQKPA